ncbi:transglycosylase SLT domain-containing protein [Solidesulfovibrio sp.]|uniref:lytic transglycosylase domain-containing protein n=1 Tax=Solidesulfovibrio sp. TaxID=2910990 RepID=UPI0026068B58|nr:transglycosylase SLT domain-containing protein [Solidesulfovibrio sp.]
MSTLVALLLCLPLAAPAAGAGQPWSPPADPADVPLPRSARLGAAGEETAKSLAGKNHRPAGVNAPAGAEAVRGITEVLDGRRREGAARLAAVAGRAGELSDAVAYYLGLGRYLSGDAAGAVAALAGLADAPETSFLGRDVQYLAVQAASRAGDQARALAWARAWLTEADPTLAPEVWLRAAVAAEALGRRREAVDFLRHLSLTWPDSRAARAGNALARRMCGGDASGGQGAALDPPGGIIPPGPPEREEKGVCYDPDGPSNVLLRAEAMVEKGAPQAALELLEGRRGFDAGQAARAEYVRGKALYRLRRFKAGAEAFARTAAADPASSLAGWARYHEARCLWRSYDDEDLARMEALLRQVLDAPVRDDPLREVAARHLALLLVERGRFADALQAAGRLKGLAVSPDLAAQGASLTALLRFVTGDFAGAVADMEAFAAGHPDDDWADGARYWRGKALAAMARPEEAARAYLDALSRRPNSYYGGLAQSALAAMGKAGGAAALASPVREGPRCPGRAEAPSPRAAAALAKARLLDDSGLPALAEMQLDFASRAMPDRADLAMAHIEAAEDMGRRGAVMRTAWRSFGGCLMRGTAADLLPLRQALYPRAHANQVVAALAGSGIDPDVVSSLIRQESFFDPRAVSGAGAVGLMQLMPDTARGMGKKLGLKVDREALFDPAVNIRLGVAFFRERVAGAGSLAAALAGYNAGQNRAAVWVRGFGNLGEELFTELIPYTETRDYVRRIDANAMMYARLYGR